MREFWIRFSLFSLLWAGVVYQYFDSSLIAVILFVCAMAMGAYFYLPVVRRPIYLYLAILVLIFSAPLLFGTKGSTYSILLLLYLNLEAIYQLPIRSFRIFTISSFFLGALSFWLIGGWRLEWFLFLLLFYFLGVSLNRMVVEREEQKEIYDQLVGEYRKLKRMNYEADRAARLEERTRIARNIHDSVGHRLTALMMQLEILSMQKKTADYSELKKLAQDSLQETREAVKALREEEYEGIATVLHLIRKLESESHIFIHFTTKQGVLSAKLTNQQSIVLYRVIQEALTNAMRHAHSRDVQVVLSRSAIGEIQFEISNRVYEPKPFQFGFGLSNMKERVEEIGGVLNIYQTESQFIVSGTFPVKEKDA